MLVKLPWQKNYCFFGGQEAGAVRKYKIKKKGATSDFMEIERQGGFLYHICTFNYQDKKINILDTRDTRILLRILLERLLQ
jgi:peptide subunit release factor RF-3